MQPLRDRVAILDRGRRRCFRSEKYADCSIISAKSNSSIGGRNHAGEIRAGERAGDGRAFEHHRNFRLVHPSRTKATLAPALVATTEMRLAPTATFIGIVREDDQRGHDKHAAAEARQRADEARADREREQSEQDVQHE